MVNIIRKKGREGSIPPKYVKSMSKNGSRILFRKINKLSKKEVNGIPTLIMKGKKYRSIVEKVEVLAEIFTTPPTPPDIEEKHLQFRKEVEEKLEEKEQKEVDCSKFRVGYQEIRKMIMESGRFKAAGEDLIPNKLLKLFFIKIVEIGCLKD